MYVQRPFNSLHSNSSLAALGSFVRNETVRNSCQILCVKDEIRENSLNNTVKLKNAPYHPHLSNLKFQEKLTLTIKTQINPTIHNHMRNVGGLRRAKRPRNFNSSPPQII